MKKRISGVITLIFLAAAIYVVVLPSRGVLGRNIFASQDVPLKKELPKKVDLDKDSISDKWGTVAFDHETHSTKNYSPDGKTMITCVDCHHTDQPESALKPPLKKSERKVALTLEALKAPDALGVKICRTCHLQVDGDPAQIPKVTYPGADTPTKLTNDNAYHLNCEVCHDNAIKARPELKDKIGGSDSSSKSCARCHLPI